MPVPDAVLIGFLAARIHCNVVTLSCLRWYLRPLTASPPSLVTVSAGITVLEEVAITLGTLESDLHHFDLSSVY